MAPLLPPAGDDTLAHVAARYRLGAAEALGILPPDTPPVRAFCERWDISPALVWALLIDLQKLDLGFGSGLVGNGVPGVTGPLAFENEPGYLRGLLAGFTFMLATLGAPLTPALLCALHDAAVAGVIRTTGRPFRLGFATRPWRYGFLWNVEGMLPEFPTMSREAWAENFSERIVHVPWREWVDSDVLDLWTPGPRDGFLVRLGRMRKPAQFFLEPIWASRRGAAFVAERDARLAGTIHAFHRAVATAEDDAAWLAAVVRLCRTLELLHLFPDGNGRTIYGLLLQKLLIERGRGPIVLETPCTFDGYYSTPEMAAIVARGPAHLARVREALTGAT
jgi:hypothetical protein